MTTDTPVRWVFLVMLVAGGVTWLVWWLWWRRDDRAHHLAAGIADEQRTEAAGEPTDVILAVDPPVARAYIPPAGMVLYRGGAVHPECAQRWLRFDLTPVDGCAVWLTDSLKEIVT